MREHEKSVGQDHPGQKGGGPAFVCNGPQAPAFDGTWTLNDIEEVT
jgi:hypothetical protein